VRYSHIIDAETGRPITHTTASVTVLADSAMLADAWATALLALGRERGMDVSTALDLAVFFIVRDESSGEDGFMTVATPKFQALQVKE
jgi:thiamine biosynthesis lipoprotein